MFTGIIEALGKITDVEQEGTNYHFTIQSPVSEHLKVDQSVSHNGVCLTVTAVDKDCHRVTAIDETLNRSALRHWEPSTEINMERSLKMGDRLDGHMVQGHVDTTALCTSVEEVEGSWIYRFKIQNPRPGLLVEKGSISIDGVSLTLVDVLEQEFSVAIIPYTYEHTIFHNYQKGSQVNIEYDMMGKYIMKWLEQAGKAHIKG